VLETLARYQTPGCSVNELVLTMGLPQPVVSKHLAVLKEVGLVSIEKKGRQHFYQVNGEGVRVIHEWTSRFEKFWTQQISNIKERAERRAKELAAKPEARHEPD
jgi:DNA-binding transcriptional ArsR family regulator